MISSQDIFSKYDENSTGNGKFDTIGTVDNGTINETHKLYNKVNFDEISNKSLYDKIDEYKEEIIKLNKKVKAYEKIINEQKNKIRATETNIIKLEEDVGNCNNIITIQEDIIQKSRNINNTLYERLRQK